MACPLPTTSYYPNHLNYHKCISYCYSTMHHKLLPWHIATHQGTLDYGQVRVWGAVGWGLTSAIAGYIYQTTTLYSMFAITALLAVLTLPLLNRLDFSALSNPTDTSLKDPLNSIAPADAKKLLDSNSRVATSKPSLPTCFPDFTQVVG